MVKKDYKHEYLAFSTEDVVQSKASGKRAGAAAPTEPRGPMDPLPVRLHDVSMSTHSNCPGYTLIYLLSQPAPPVFSFFSLFL
jgi:hypothetical protein